jgi:hypothetical protein
MKAAIATLESELTKYVLTDSITVTSAHFDVLMSIEVKTHVLTCLQKDIDTVTNHINLHDCQGHAVTRAPTKCKHK